MSDSYEQRLMEQTSTGLWMLASLVLIVCSPLLVLAWALGWLAEVLEDMPWIVFRVVITPVLILAWMIGGLTGIIALLRAPVGPSDNHRN